MVEEEVIDTDENSQRCAIYSISLVKLALLGGE
jgi:hypothetical protein